MQTSHEDVFENFNQVKWGSLATNCALKSLFDVLNIWDLIL